jgi:hypothetical protein
VKLPVVSELAISTSLVKVGSTPAFLLARVSPLAAAWLPLSDSDSATAGGAATALVLATFGHVAST